MMSDKIRRHHLDRRAILYVRQSSSHQVPAQSRESGTAIRSARVSYRSRLVRVVDDDLGRSAAGSVTRAGFVVAEVCLGKVGAVAAREVSRFARNSRDWQQLIETGRVVDSVLVDQETIYLPRHGDDRLLLGLKRTLNEYELDLLRQRSLAARYEKARRGELVAAAPVGFVRAGDQLEKDPDRWVQQATRLVFDKVAELSSARQALLWFHEHGLDRPPDAAAARSSGAGLAMRGSPDGDEPAYAYGKTGAVAQYSGPAVGTKSRRKPRAEWLALKPTRTKVISIGRAQRRSAGW